MTTPHYVFCPLLHVGLYPLSRLESNSSSRLFAIVSYQYEISIVVYRYPCFLGYVYVGSFRVVRGPCGGMYVNVCILYMYHILAREPT
jgi:hypothetical protein